MINRGLLFWAFFFVGLFYIFECFTFVEKSELRLWRGLHLWKNRFTFVGVLRCWVGLRLKALQMLKVNGKAHKRFSFC